MTDSTAMSAAPARGLSFSALALGAISLLCAIIFAATSAGPLPLFIGATAGLAALIVGIIALKNGQPKGPALIGLIVGSLVLLLSLILFLFALLFVGVLAIGNV